MISIASDHGGYRLKEHIKAYLTAKGLNVLDCGCDSLESCDYPVFGKAAAQAAFGAGFMALAAVCAQKQNGWTGKRNVRLPASLAI